jgi:hypothetical protein
MPSFHCTEVPELARRSSCFASHGREMSCGEGSPEGAWASPRYAQPCLPGDAGDAGDEAAEGHKLRFLP